MIEALNLTKTFTLPLETGTKENNITVVSALNFKIPTGAWCSLVGASGSGKSTLLTLLAGLDLPSAGKVLVNEKNLTELTEDERSDFRAKNMGFIFQNFRLLPHLNALENVRIPLEILEDPGAEERARKMLERVGLGHRMGNLPSQLSGGEQQRVAVARAFVTHPKILFADEPTGNLDSKNGGAVLDIMKELHEEYKSTLIVVTHDAGVSRYGQQMLRLKDGVLVEHE